MNAWVGQSALDSLSTLHFALILFVMVEINKHFFLSCPKVRIKGEEARWMTSNNPFLSNPHSFALLPLASGQSCIPPTPAKTASFTHGFLRGMCALNWSLKEGSSHSATSPSRHLIKNMSVSLAIKETEFKKCRVPLCITTLASIVLKWKLPKFNKDLTKWAFSHTAGEFCWRHHLLCNMY